MENNDFIVVNDIKLYPLNILNIKPNYYISKNGDIYNKLTNKFLGSTDKDGYHIVSLKLNDGNNYKEFRVARLVLYKFLGKPPLSMKDPTSEHKDGNIDNNCIDNLCWLERGKNSSIRRNKGVGVDNHEAKLSELDVIKIADLLIEDKLTLKEIGDLFNVHKSTISNIKRKKNWSHLLINYNFNIAPTLTRKEQQERMRKLDDLLLKGYSYKQLVELGYASTSICRHKDKLFGSTGI